MKLAGGLQILHHGSVKDIYQDLSRPQNQNDQLLFRFSNRYSIFDWGEMPDAIPYKGQALAEMGRKLLKYLETRGIPTHYLDAPIDQPEDMIVKAVDVPRDGPEGSAPEAYAKRPVNILVPLEVIYRFGAPKGSSLLRKYKTEAEWKAAGFDRAYTEGEDFSQIALDVTTKLEKMDRPLTNAEAKTLAGMSEAEWDSLITFTKKIAVEVRDVFTQAGMKLWDGKLEFAFAENKNNPAVRSFVLVDTIGLDEIRLTYNGKTLSKELLRQFYLQSDWYAALQIAKDKSPADFKNYCQNILNQKPSPLPTSFIQAISTVYSMVTAMILNSDAQSLSEQKLKLDHALNALTNTASPTGSPPPSDAITTKINVMVIGSGGREHALAWRLAQDSTVKSVFVYPGNPGMKQTPGLTILPSKTVSFDEAVSIAKKNEVSLAVIGPEKFLYEGWVDQFQKQGVLAFGPTKAASFLEESKIRSKIFMKANRIPTADFVRANSLTEAFMAIDTHPKWKGFVLKLSGPAQGKGVIVTRTSTEAKDAARQFFEHRPAGIEEGMVIEEFIRGREVSLFYVCHGENFRFLASACDHKRLKDHDQGPNTGGMGAYSPANWFTKAQLAQVEKQIVIPTLRAMKQDGAPFCGMLFLGLMVSPDHPPEQNLFLLEYNTRFGDPETQTFLPLLQGNFAQLLEAASRGDEKLFRSTELQTNGLASVHVVKAAQGYPGLFGEKVEIGVPIEISKSSTASQIFFAGVSEKEGTLYTNGGRVLGLTAVAQNQAKAYARAYQDLTSAHFAREHYRTDIGQTDIEQKDRADSDAREGLEPSPRIAIFASGTGSNALNLLQQAKKLKQAQIPLLIVDRADSPLPQKIKDEFPHVTVQVILPSENLKGAEKKSEHESRIVAALRAQNINWCFLAGYMRILGPTLREAFQNRDGTSRIVNIHPSLLPAYPGIHSYERAFADEVKESGVTIHFVDAGVDTGPILLQKSFPREPGDTIEAFKSRGLSLEWKLYAEILQRLDEKGTLS